jgi:hypothetical protein
MGAIRVGDQTVPVSKRAAVTAAAIGICLGLVWLFACGGPPPDAKDGSSTSVKADSPIREAVIRYCKA